ncbi:MAG: hypothetical protein H0T79_08705 [Deltaproteobacteria bacterium]|nr:hypothetical protein [Deltaproteobacteria bacterium]
MTTRFPLLSVAVGALGLLALASIVDVGTAEAGRGRWGGGARWGGNVRWSGGVHVGPSVRVHYARPAWRPTRWSVGGSIWIGGSYNPRPVYYYPEYVPSYYGASYYPVQPVAAPAATTYVVAAPERPALPRFGVGLFAGGASVEDSSESSDIGVLGRFRLSGGLLVEGELGKTSYEENLRVDRRLGASLVYEIGAYNRLAPYILGGLGVQEAETNGSYNTKQSFAEIGAGLRYALTPAFHITADIRAGSRSTMSNDQMDTLGDSNSTARTIAPPSTSDSDTSEEYTRARLSAILYF